MKLLSKNVEKFLYFLSFVLLLSGCQLQHQPADSMEHHHESRMQKAEKAVCVLYPTEGNDVTGTVTFTKLEEGVMIVANIKGLSPGEHGFHIHEYGDCSGADGKTAGGHYNPAGANHGGPGDAVRHIGDLGNIVADENGIANLEVLDTVISLEGRFSIIGKGIIVHDKVDDLKSQPTGNAGARVACGVIGLAGK